MVGGTPTVDRFEVRSGDQTATDASSGSTVERSELAAQETRHQFGSDVWVSMAMRASGLPATWTIAGQFKATGDDGDFSASPILVQQFTGSTFQILTRASTDDPLLSSPSATSRYSGTWTHDDTYANLVYRIRFSRGTTDGELQVWLDGTEIVNLTGIAIGYNDVEGPYYKYGIYRSAASETTVIEYVNVEVSTSSLLDRVANPLPTP